MKRFLVAVMIAVSAAAVVVPEADAKRMGGGSSIGRQSQSMNRQATPPAPANQPSAANQARPGNQATPATAPRPSPWRGILGGALLGLGLGALLSHLGIGGALASVIGTILTFALIALAIMFIVRLVRGKKGGNQPAFAGAGAGAGGGFGSQPMARTPEIGSGLNQPATPVAFQDHSATASAADAGAVTMDVPADFDVPGFLRHAKTYFIRLQAAWDRADVNDIREFTTPEMFGELRLQLQERGASANHTDVVSLDADLVGMERSGSDYVASVRFSGMIREEENAPAQPFAEAWHLVKPASGQGGWLLAGIQQLS